MTSLARVLNGTSRLSFPTTVNQILSEFDIPSTDAMKVDVQETDEALILTADVPGYSKEEMSISYENGNLTIAATHQDKKQEEFKYVRRERSVSNSISRSFRLGTDLDPNSITAAVKDGILTVNVKKNENTKLRKIEIK